jgi:hypothetical protein
LITARSGPLATKGLSFIGPSKTVKDFFLTERIHSGKEMLIRTLAMLTRMI